MLKNLNPLFSGAYSLRFRPILNSLHLDLPELNETDFSEINSILKAIAKEGPLSLTLTFKSAKHLSLTIQGQTESITIQKLRPMYSLKQKLEKSNPQTVELCLFNYRHSGLYIGTTFKLKLEQ